VVSAISQLGHALHLQLVAEGIEQEEQVSTLQALACQYGQGYFFARPLNRQAMTALLDERSGPFAVHGTDVAAAAR
jgi:EAL domain-containing protein (putative c-di-GMP-specific phosphodiesterase class I)